MTKQEWAKKRQAVRKAFEAMDAESANEFKNAYYKAVEGLEAMIFCVSDVIEGDANFRDKHGVTMSKAMKPAYDAFNAIEDAVFGEIL